ncbi:unnamed protein product [Phytophthora lilii]|uniref:Unnamed protein product n=1 Tax=Phytophthora lilii TaxID=2077276 RepID=A0A9W6XFV3_9STRA|nr:unnamed protein product [Phytophthora lilii]
MRLTWGCDSDPTSCTRATSWETPKGSSRTRNATCSFTCCRVSPGPRRRRSSDSGLLTTALSVAVPKEYFDVAFCMFDLDGDGSVDKAEFCAVVENVLRAITSPEDGEEMAVSAEETLPRLTKFLFGRFGKTITAKDLAAALDTLRKQILRAEFDLYATVNPLTKQQTMSVHDFALTLISCFDPEKLPPYLDRVQTLNASDVRRAKSRMGFIELIFCDLPTVFS